MRDDVQAIHAAMLDDLLCRWHTWQADYSPVRGHKGRALVCGDYNAGRHYDAENGVDDDAIERRTMQAVDSAISGLPDIERNAISMEARNLASGCALWRSPRLPADPAQRAVIVAQARAMLTRKLLQAGVM